MNFPIEMGVGEDLAKLVLVTYRAKLVLVTYRAKVVPVTFRSHYILQVVVLIVDHRLRFRILYFLSFAYFISICQITVDLTTYTHLIRDFHILYVMIDNQLPITNHFLIYD